MNQDIHIEGLSPTQMRIANLLWNCETKEQVNAVCVLLGHEAWVVKEMIVAATLDTVDQTNIAQEILDQFRI